MVNNRLSQVEKNLNLLREQLAGQEKTLIMIAPEERVRIQQLIAETKGRIREFEVEYWRILAKEPSNEFHISKQPSPEVVVAEIVERAKQLSTNSQYSTEVLEWLQKIYIEVSRPEPHAAAKLEGVLSLLPPFVNLSYKAELDTESFLQMNFPTFTRWYKALAKKL
ncbi:MAG: hypothetical protein AAGG02_20740 [Cyanobacteria bacterium P01_H01_bin.15]